MNGILIVYYTIKRNIRKKELNLQIKAEYRHPFVPHYSYKMYLCLP